MRKLIAMIFLIVIIILRGCNSNDSSSSEITEEEAKQIIKEEHYSKHGEVEIISVCEKPDKYVIEWEINRIEHGKDSVFKDSGETKLVKSSRGSCRWK